MLCAMGCGCTVGVILYTFADIISLKRLGNACTAPMLRILAFALPFTAMSSVLGGYFTAKGMILPYSCIQLIEQGIKTLSAMLLIKGAHTPQSACTAVITAMVASEALSFLLSFALKKSAVKKGAADKSVRLKSFFRIALPDAAGTCVRSILLTVEHLLIPKGFERSGEGSSAALAAYGNIQSCDEYHAERGVYHIVIHRVYLLIQPLQHTVRHHVSIHYRYERGEYADIKHRFVRVIYSV